MSTVAVIGGGVIGSAIACWLIDEGHSVAVFERDTDGMPASAGNTGFIAIPQIKPLASSGTLARIPRWWLDPSGPLAVRWRDAPGLTAWLAGFVRSASAERQTRSMDALAGLARTALEDHFELARRANLSGHLRNPGALSVHATMSSLKNWTHAYEAVAKLVDIDCKRISANDAREMVPQLEGEFAGAIHFKEFWIVNEPLMMLRRLQHFAQANGSWIRERVAVLRSTTDGIEVHGDSEVRRFDKAVVAAGVWSRSLVRDLGLKILLAAERGYNVTWRDPSLRLPLPLVFSDHGFGVAPLDSGLRVGGTVELAPPDAPPNFARARSMQTVLRRYLPSLSEDGATMWMGSRPSTPDSVPVIGRHPRDDRIVFAFGHGHLGLTHSAVTARLVGALIGAGAVPEALKPFGIDRFQ